MFIFSFLLFPYSAVPNIELPPADVEVISPTMAVFYCNVQGFFPPNITWQFNGSPLQTGEDIQIDIETGLNVTRRNSTLYIENTEPSDAGIYTCLAENNAGNASASAELTVLCMPIQHSTPLSVVILSLFHVQILQL